MSDVYQPRPEHKFTFGLWTVGNPGRDPFGEPVRPVLKPVELVHLLAEVGAYRDGFNFLPHYGKDQKYALVFPLEAKPNEPRHDMYLPTTGSILGFIETLDHKEMVGVNPEVAHEHMSGLNFMHAIAQAWDAKKLFHIDLNDQAFGRYDQDLRFGSHSLKSCFFVVKFLEDVGYAGSRHFDSHAYRTEDVEGVKDFARGSMRSYLISKDK